MNLSNLQNVVDCTNNTPANAFLWDLAAIRDSKFGMIKDVHLCVDDPSGNAILYEAHACWILRDITNNAQMYTPNWFYIIENCSQNGLLKRKPQGEACKHDDYLGAASISIIQASNIIRHGMAHGWFFDAIDPDATFWSTFKDCIKTWDFKPLTYWHSRFMGLRQHYYINCMKAKWYLWPTWLLNIWWDTRSGGDESRWLLDYLMVRSAMEYKNTLLGRLFAKLACRRLTEQLNKFYGGNIANVYRLYFRWTPKHPLATYSNWPKTQESQTFS